MKKVDLGRAVGTLANLGVIAGLIFLGFELQQNNLLINAQTRAETNRTVIEQESEPYRNHDVAVLLAKQARGEPLSDVDEIKMRSLATSTIPNFYFQFREVQDGALPADGFSLAAWRQIYRGDGPQGDIWLDEVWPDMRANLNSDFVEYFESNVISD
jgi:hypothetical protein